MRFESLGLRIRMLLFFAAIAAGGIVSAVAGFAVAYRRMGLPADASPLVQGGIVAGFGILGLSVWIWYLFDLHVARPIESIASAMRARTHAFVATGLSSGEGRYLGDLAAAVSATAAELAEGRNAIAESIARETSRLSSDKERLEHLLADVPPAVLLCTGRHRLVFYNGVAQRLLSETGKAVCLDRNLFDYLNDGPVRSAHRRLLEVGTPDAVVEFFCVVMGGTRRLAGRMRLAGDNGGSEGAYVMTLRDVSDELSAFARRDRLLDRISEEVAPELERLVAENPDDGVPGSLPFELARIRERLAGLSASRGEDSFAFATRVTAGVQTPTDQIEPLHSVVYDFDLLARSHPEKIVRAGLDELNYVVFDTETTGLLPRRGDEIVQIAAVRVVNGKVVRAEAFEALVNPGRPIPPSATAIHGVSDAMVAGAPSAIEVIDRFHHFCEGSILVAHNAPFDMAFLYRRETDIGRKFANPVLDTVLLSAVVFGRWDEHSLDALVERLDIELPAESRHTAIGDAVATAEAFIKLKNILLARGVSRLEDLLNETRRHGRLLKDLNTGL